MAYLAKCPRCGSQRRIDERQLSLDELIMRGPQSHECSQCHDRFYAVAPPIGEVADGETLDLFFERMRPPTARMP